MIDQVMAYVVLPVGGFVWWMHQKQQIHYTKITVLEKLFEQTNLTHDREIKEIKDHVRDINAKLDRIEQGMRNNG
jgi:hypothetical protein